MGLSHTLAHPGTDGRLPTLIALHGYGSHAYDLLGLAPLLAGGGLLVICPQAPHTIEPGIPGYSWSSTILARDDEAPDLSPAVQSVLALVDHAITHYPVDPERIAILGFSQGGGVAARVALAAPERFAGVALLSTSTDEERGGALTAAPGAGRMAALVQHGSNDATVAIAEAFATLMRLQTLGLKPEFQQFAMQHEVTAESAQSLSTWLTQVLRLGSGGR
jgi:phospholipase/carboxylesterase